MRTLAPIGGGAVRLGAAWVAAGRAIVGWLVIAVLVAAARPATADDPSPFPDIQRIIEAGELKVAVINDHVPPMITRDEQGNLDGFDIRLAEAIARSLSVKATFIRNANTFDGVVARVAAGDADIAASFLSRTSARARYVLFSRPYLVQRQTVLINRLEGVSRFRRCPTLAEALEIAKWPGQVGVLAGSSYERFLRDVVADAQPAVFPSHLDLMTAAYRGDIVISYQGEMWAHHYLTRNPSYRIRLRLCPIGELVDNIAIAVRADAPNLLAYIDTFLEQRRVTYTVEEIVNHEGAWTFRGF